MSIEEFRKETKSYRENVLSIEIVSIPNNITIEEDPHFEHLLPILRKPREKKKRVICNKDKNKKKRKRYCNQKYFQGDDIFQFKGES